MGYRRLRQPRLIRRQRRRQGDRSDRGGRRLHCRLGDGSGGDEEDDLAAVVSRHAAVSSIAVIIHVNLVEGERVKMVSEWSSRRRVGW